MTNGTDVVVIFYQFTSSTDFAIVADPQPCLDSPHVGGGYPARLGSKFNVKTIKTRKTAQPIPTNSPKECKRRITQLISSDAPGPGRL